MEFPIAPVCNPAFVRTTLSKIPRTSAILYKTKIPLGICVTPYPNGIDDASIPFVERQNLVRCRRCRAYLNPYVEITHQGVRWKCNLCFIDNECMCEIFL